MERHGRLQIDHGVGRSKKAIEGMEITNHDDERRGRTYSVQITSRPAGVESRSQPPLRQDHRCSWPASPGLVPQIAGYWEPLRSSNHVRAGMRLMIPSHPTLKVSHDHVNKLSCSMLRQEHVAHIMVLSVSCIFHRQARGACDASAHPRNVNLGAPPCHLKESA